MVVPDNILPVFKLPPRLVMLVNLLLVDSDENIVKYFYPKLLAMAGEQMTAEAVILLLDLAIAVYARSSETSATMEAALHKKMPEFIDALVDNPELAEEVKGLFKEVRGEVEEKIEKKGVVVTPKI
ncbi:MAG: hypothetical protein WAW90_02330 [Minisyncoccia bacterium]